MTDSHIFLLYDDVMENIGKLKANQDADGLENLRGLLSRLTTRTADAISEVLAAKPKKPGPKPGTKKKVKAGEKPGETASPVDPIESSIDPVTGLESWESKT